MSESGTSPTAYDTSLAKNEYVQELFSILQAGGRDTNGLSALLSHVAEMETFVKSAEDKISTMKDQLAEMKEVQSHPVKTALQKAIKSLEHTVSVMKDQIGKLKSEIINGCKNAVTAFKEKGISALDKLASFFHIKGGLRDMQKNIERSIKIDDKAIAQINAFAEQYHSAGNALKNMGRVLVGREPVDAKKEAGILAKAVAAPYKANTAIMRKMGKTIDSALQKLEQLEAAVQARDANRVRERRPQTLMGEIREAAQLVAQRKLELPAPERVKAKGLEV